MAVARWRGLEAPLLRGSMLILQEFAQEPSVAPPAFPISILSVRRTRTRAGGPFNMRGGEFLLRTTLPWPRGCGCPRAMLASGSVGIASAGSSSSCFYELEGVRQGEGLGGVEENLTPEIK